MYRIDYAQHHRYAILSELDLHFYQESFFPSVLFKYLTPLTGVLDLAIRPCCRRDDPSDACRNAVAYVRKMSANPKSLESWYSLKLWLQTILLLPTLYLQAQGTSVYKRESFALARPGFSGDAWAIVDKASRIRELGLQQALVVFP